MKQQLLKFIIIFASIFSLQNSSFAQAAEERIMYIVDSIPVLKDPEEGDEILQTDIESIVVVKNKDSLKNLGYEKFDGVIYLFTKAYSNRPDSIKLIPSSKQMVRKNGVWLFNNSPYSGSFIDYYYSGKKQGDGELFNGKINKKRKLYYQNGLVSVEKTYIEGVENEMEIEYYTDGSMKQKGAFVNGKEEGIWDMFFPNGQVKQRSNFKNGIIEGESFIYYSTGKLMAVEITKTGKTYPDKRLEKVYELMKRSKESNMEGNTKAAIKYCSKAIEADSSYAEAYFSRGTILLNEMKFDEAITDLDKALQLEPYMEKALTNRAFSRIRKYELGGSRTISKNTEVTILVSKDQVIIPQIEKEKICEDLNTAIFLGDKRKMINEAIAKYCLVNNK